MNKIKKRRMKTMKKLTQEKINLLLIERSAASKDPKIWEKFYDKENCPVILEAPLGALLNEKISGYVMAWNFKKGIQVPAMFGDRKNQAIEGNFSVETSLISALNVITEIGKINCSIFVREGI